MTLAEAAVRPKGAGAENLLHRAAPWLVAAALQIGVTVAVGGQSLRLSAADVVLPVLLLGWAVFQMLRYGIGEGAKGFLPDLRLCVWAAIATAWMTFALINGHDSGAQWSAWAVQNKYMGWFALMFFLFSGYVLARADEQFVGRLFFAYVRVGWAIAFFTVVAFALTNWFVLPRVAFFGPDSRAIGLLANPNAYGLAAATALVLQMAARHEHGGRPWVEVAGLALLMSAVVLSGSRSAWLGAAAGVAITVLLRVVNWRVVVPATVVAVLLLAAIATVHPKRHSADSAYTPEIYISSAQFFDAGQHSANARVEQVRRALALWREEPLLGVGIGRFIELERTLGLTWPQQIHSSYLWLLVETGVPGLLVVGGLFSVLVLLLRRSTPVLRGTAAGGMAALAAFAAFALFQEALYQRHVWTFAGVLFASCLALPQPVSRRRSTAGSGTSRGQ